jgi:hypothetical protein
VGNKSAHPEARVKAIMRAIYPRTKKPVNFEAPLPEDFLAALRDFMQFV